MAYFGIPVIESDKMPEGYIGLTNGKEMSVTKIEDRTEIEIDIVGWHLVFRNNEPYAAFPQKWQARELVDKELIDDNVNYQIRQITRKIPFPKTDFVKVNDELKLRGLV